MTIEEKADEIMKTKILPCYHVLSPNMEKIHKQAIIYAITEGRKERWHDLRVNPNDLPEEGVEVLVVYSNTYGDNGLIVNKHTLNYELAQYINDEDDITEWYWVESGTDDFLHEVIAWTERTEFTIFEG